MKIVLNELIKCILITSFVVFQALSFLMTLTMYCMLCNFPDVVFRFLIYELYELQWLKMMLCKTNKLHCCRKKMPYIGQMPILQELLMQSCTRNEQTIDFKTRLKMLFRSKTAIQIELSMQKLGIKLKISVFVLCSAPNYKQSQ